MIVKAENLAQGSNTRYLVTNLRAEAKYLYDRIYCARGDRIASRNSSLTCSPTAWLMRNLARR